MAIYDKIQKTMSDRDVNAYLELLHEDAIFVFHKYNFTLFLSTQKFTLQ